MLNGQKYLFCSIALHRLCKKYCFYQLSNCKTDGPNTCRYWDSCVKKWKTISKSKNKINKNVKMFVWIWHVHFPQLKCKIETGSVFFGTKKIVCLSPLVNCFVLSSVELIMNTALPLLILCSFIAWIGGYSVNYGFMRFQNSRFTLSFPFNNL